MKPAWNRCPFAAPDCGSLQTPRPARFRREHYLLLLGWAFAFFNSLRLVSYLPTLALIVEQQNSNQHSLLTWLTLACANVTMAMWVYEHNGRRFERLVIINAMNTVMCLLTAGVIAAYRFSGGS